MRPRTADGNGAFTAGVLAVAGVFYAWVLTRGSFDPFGEEKFGLAFNSMLDHMLRGRWDVDPVAIGAEGFVHDGRSYAYFGPFPAALRLPLVLLPGWRDLHVERLSCWLAIMIGVLAQIRTITAVLARADTVGGPMLAPPLVVVCALSGAPMLLGWKGALIYHEAILWAWALAMMFVALALPAVQRAGPISGWRLCALGGCAGLCLLTRSTTGAGLCLAAGLLLLRQFGWNRSFWAPAGVLGVCIALTGVVNQERWGNPLVFANLGLQRSLVDLFPDRMARLQRFGLFDWHRFDVGVLYYLFPVWTDRLEQAMPLRDRLFDLYDAIELPASSLLLTDPAWCMLSGLGVWAIVRRRVSAGEMLVAGSLLVAPVLMVLAWYLAFRYRVEFAPLLLVLSCIGLGDRALRRAGGVMWAVGLLQVSGALVAGWDYAGQPFGPSSGYAALSVPCAIAPESCAQAGR